MDLLENYDIDSNFWEQNPQLKYFNVFADLFNNDKSKGKSESSRLMWSIFLYVDPVKSKFNRLLEEEKLIEIKIYNPDFNPKLKSQVTLIEKYESLILSKAKKLFRDWETKLEEREKFISKTKYTDENWKMLDAMMADTPAIWKQYNLVKETMMEEETKTQIKGGRKESKSEKGEI